MVSKLKYLILVPDGAADYNIPELGMHTPFDTANKPVADMLAHDALIGTVSNVPDGMVPESDTANLAIMSYDPAVYSRGRSPLEAVSMGLTMSDGDIAFRCNVVTLSDDEPIFTDKTILDHSADEITTPEAAELIKAVDEKLSTDTRSFYPGVSYRHCMIWNNPPAYREFMRPHDILGRKIESYLPDEPYLSLMRDSYEVLDHHPVNEARRARGLRPANSIWLWSPGGKPSLPSFTEKWGVSASVISAVDLIKGIGICAGMEVINVDGATGNIKTNFDGKAEAAIDAFKRGRELVYIHVEAPDECGHRAEIENKVKSIELIDSKVLAPIYEYLKACGEAFRIMYLPDHPTPVSLRTHSMEPVPFFIYSSAEPKPGVAKFNETSAAATNNYIPQGSSLMEMFIRG